MGDILYRLECHDKLDGRTVRIGNDAAGCIQRILRIDLRHHERHVGIHAERARIVYHQRPVFRNGLLELFGSTAARRYERHIHPLEIVVVAKLLHLHPLAAELIKTARAALRTEQQQFIHRKIPVCQYPQELLPYGAARADNRYFHFRLCYNSFFPVHRTPPLSAGCGTRSPVCPAGPHRTATSDRPRISRKTRRRPNSPSPPHCRGNGTLWLPADGRNGLSSALPTRGRHTLSS